MLAILCSGFSRLGPNPNIACRWGIIRVTLCVLSTNKTVTNLRVRQGGSDLTKAVIRFGLEQGERSGGFQTLRLFVFLILFLLLHRVFVAVLGFRLKMFSYEI